MSSLHLQRGVLGCLALAVAVAGMGGGACGSSNSGGNADAFVGTWTYGTGSTITPMMCTVLGTTIPAIPLDGDTLIISKTDASHVSVDAGAGCVLTFSVNGSVATATSGQSCSITVSSIPVTLTVSSWTLTLSGAGMLASSESGAAPLGGASCTATGAGNLTGGPVDGG